MNYKKELEIEKCYYQYNIEAIRDKYLKKT